MVDEILLQHIKEGSQLAFASLYKKYAHNVYALSYKYLGSKEAAEDAVQNLFLKIWNIRADIDENKPFEYFLFTILKNYLLNVIRDSKDYCILDNCLEALNVIDNGEIDDVNMEQSQLEVVKKAVQILSPQRRKILTMKISGKYSNQEIADKLNLSVNTIKFQYSQALKQIRLYSFDYSKKSWTV